MLQYVFNNEQQLFSPFTLLLQLFCDTAFSPSLIINREGNQIHRLQIVLGCITGGHCSAVKSQVSCTLKDYAGSQRRAESLSTLRKDSTKLIRHKHWGRVVRLLCTIWANEKKQKARLKCSSALMERKDWVDKSAARQSSGAHLLADSRICSTARHLFHSGAFLSALHHSLHLYIIFISSLTLLISLLSF